MRSRDSERVTASWMAFLLPTKMMSFRARVMAV